MKSSSYAVRRTAIRLLHQQKRPSEVAEALGRSLAWVYKWQRRYEQDKDLSEHLRRPHHSPRAIGNEMREAICRIRPALEVEREEPENLCYIGAPAIQHRLGQEGWNELPSISTIESVLRQAGLTYPPSLSSVAEIAYPAIQPDAAQELIEVGIVPDRLPGGATIACFNAIDVVSRNATGVQHTDKCATTAVDVLVQLCQTLGIPRYTQVDNESCFSGGFTHPYVIGQVAKLALLVGTELVFTPFYHPESNGAIERFHQDYNQHVWGKHYLTNLLSVQTASNGFFAHYRHSGHIRRYVHVHTGRTTQEWPWSNLSGELGPTITAAAHEWSPTFHPRRHSRTTDSSTQCRLER